MLFEFKQIYLFICLFEFRKGFLMIYKINYDTIVIYLLKFALKRGINKDKKADY